MSATELIVSGRVWRAVWFLAWPTAINNLIATAYTLINRAFVGRLPNADEALAAVGIGGVVLMIQFGVVIALAVGTSALVARFLGAEEPENAEEATRQSLILGVLGGIVTGLPLIFFSGFISRLVGAQGHVVELTATYTSIIAWSSIPVFLFTIIVSALRSAGDVRSPLYVGIVMLVLNAGLDYLLIFGVGPWPAMGLRGAAISTVISRVVALVLVAWFLRKSVLGGSLEHLVPHRGWTMRILHIGWPAAIGNLMMSLASAGYLKILAMLPAEQVTPAQAAYAVALAIEAVSFMPGLAYSMAATPLVGQNLGAGQPERAEHSAWVAALQATAIMSIMGLAFLVIPRWLTLLFTNDALVLPLVVSYLRINSISEPFLAVALVMRGALQGAGDTRVPMWITMLSLWVVRLPLEWLLAIALGYGAAGAWVAMSATTILSGILSAAWFKWGSWRTIEV